MTSIAFSSTGEFLAIGDRAGRVSIVQELQPLSALSHQLCKFLTPQLLRGIDSDASHSITRHLMHSMQRRHHPNGIHADEEKSTADFAAPHHPTSPTLSYLFPSAFGTPDTNDTLWSWAQQRESLLSQLTLAQTRPSASSSAAPQLSNLLNAQIEYRFFCEVQAHDPEFDSLKSTEIEPKIMVGRGAFFSIFCLRFLSPFFFITVTLTVSLLLQSIEWLPSQASSLSFLSANSKTVKLWSLTPRLPSSHETESYQSYWRSHRTAQRNLLLNQCAEAIQREFTHALDDTAQAHMHSLAERQATSHLTDQDHHAWMQSHRAELERMLHDWEALPVGVRRSAEDDPQQQQQQQGPSVAATLRHTYSNAHQYNIHSVQVSCDSSTMFTCDDLRLLQWRFDHQTTSTTTNAPASNSCAVTTLDFRNGPDEPEGEHASSGSGIPRDIDELLTVCRTHPHHNQLLCLGSSKGLVRLYDLRCQSIADPQLTMQRYGRKKSSLSEITDSILDAKFSRCGRYLITRDYLSVSMYDLYYPRDAIVTYSVHPHLVSNVRLVSALKNESIFDSFSCDISPDTTFVFFFVFVFWCNNPLQTHVSLSLSLVCLCTDTSSAAPTPTHSLCITLSPVSPPPSKRRMRAANLSWSAIMSRHRRSLS